MKGRPSKRIGDLKEMGVLNRIVRITDDGLLYEADPRHAELLAKSLNLENCKFMVTPGVKLPFGNDSVSGPNNLNDH